MAQKGYNVSIYLDGSIIAGSKANTVRTECEIIELANATNPIWVKIMAGRKRWSVTVGFLVPAVADIRRLLMVGNSYTLRFRDRANSQGIQGTAILEQCEIVSNTSTLVQGTFTFRGNGQLA